MYNNRFSSIKKTSTIYSNIVYIATSLLMLLLSQTMSADSCLGAAVNKCLSQTKQEIELGILKNIDSISHNCSGQLNNSNPLFSYFSTPRTGYVIDHTGTRLITKSSFSCVNPNKVLAGTFASVLPADSKFVVGNKGIACYTGQTSCSSKCGYLKANTETTGLSAQQCIPDTECRSKAMDLVDNKWSCLSSTSGYYKVDSNACYNRKVGDVEWYISKAEAVTLYPQSNGTYTACSYVSKPCELAYAVKQDSVTYCSSDISNALKTCPKSSHLTKVTSGSIRTEKATYACGNSCKGGDFKLPVKISGGQLVAAFDGNHDYIECQSGCGDYFEYQGECVSACPRGAYAEVSGGAKWCVTPQSSQCINVANSSVEETEKLKNKPLIKTINARMIYEDQVYDFGATKLNYCSNKKTSCGELFTDVTSLAPPPKCYKTIPSGLMQVCTTQAQPLKEIAKPGSHLVIEEGTTLKKCIQLGGQTSGCGYYTKGDKYTIYKSIRDNPSGCRKGYFAISADDTMCINNCYELNGSESCPSTKPYLITNMAHLNYTPQCIAGGDVCQFYTMGTSKSEYKASGQGVRKWCHKDSCPTKTAIAIDGKADSVTACEPISSNINKTRCKAIDASKDQCVTKCSGLLKYSTIKEYNGVADVPVCTECAGENDYIQVDGAAGSPLQTTPVKKEGAIVSSGNCVQKCDGSNIIVYDGQLKYCYTTKSGVVSNKLTLSTKFIFDKQKNGFVKTCPSGKYNKTGSPSIKTCLQERYCPDNYPFVESDNLSYCLQRCPSVGSRYYVNSKQDKVCLNSSVCKGDYSFLSKPRSQECLSQCPSAANKYIKTYTGAKICQQSNTCPSTHSYIASANSTECLSTCTGGMYYLDRSGNKVCLGTSCGSNHVMVSKGSKQCVSSCEGGYTYLTGNLRVDARRAYCISRVPNQDYEFTVGNDRYVASGQALKATQENGPVTVKLYDGTTHTFKFWAKRKGVLTLLQSCPGPGETEVVSQYPAYMPLLPMCQ